jgi:hypothetical protein
MFFWSVVLGGCFEKQISFAKALLGWKALQESGPSSAHIFPTLYKFQEWVLNLDP